MTLIFTLKIMRVIYVETQIRLKSNNLIPWRKVLLEKPLVPQAVKNFPEF